MRFLENNIDLICGDCLQIMNDMAEESVDFVLTDPPYKVGKFVPREIDINFWLQEWYIPRYKEIYRVLKKDKALVTECSVYYLSEVIDCLKKIGFNYEYQIILYTTNNMRRGKLGYCHYQPALWFSKGRSKKRYCYPDVIKAALRSNKKEFSFPTPKIVEHYKKVIDIFTSENDLVLDPFIGSGTTALACVELNRKCIGIDIIPEYFDITKRRLNEIFVNQSK